MGLASHKDVTDSHSPIVAVFNTSEDTTDMLRVVLEVQGFTVVTAFTNEIRDGHVSLADLIRQHRPRVIVYDVALPYESNWRLFENIRTAPACEGIRFVLTTTNVARVRAVAGPEPDLTEIVGKPYDLGVIVAKVRDALASGSADAPPRGP